MSDNSVGAQPLFDLSGQSIVVTGGGYGLGKAMALGLSAAGANVVVAGRTRSKVEETATEIRQNGGTAIHCVFDATMRSRCDDMINTAVAQFGSIESVVINHGVSRVAKPEDTAEEDWHTVINVNLTGCFYCAQAAGTQLIKQGKGGSIVMISSNGSLVAFDGLTAYGASKGGVDMMCRQMAAEWGQYDIRVNTVNPGYTTHPMRGKTEIRTTPELEREVLKWTPLADGVSLRILSGRLSFCAPGRQSLSVGTPWSSMEAIPHFKIIMGNQEK